MEPITVFELQNLQHAARVFEIKGAEGYGEVSQKFGNDMAKGMLIMYLRGIHGSLRGMEADRNIPTQVKAMLRNFGLLNDEEALKVRSIALEEVKKQASKFIESLGMPINPIPTVSHDVVELNDVIDVDALLEELKKELESEI